MKRVNPALQIRLPWTRTPELGISQMTVKMHLQRVPVWFIAIAQDLHAGQHVRRQVNPRPCRDGRPIPRRRHQPSGKIGDRGRACLLTKQAATFPHSHDVLRADAQQAALLTP